MMVLSGFPPPEFEVTGMIKREQGPGFAIMIACPDKFSWIFIAFQYFILLPASKTMEYKLI